MPAIAAKKPGGKDGKDGGKKKKPPPSELCGCGAETYRPPPKGKKKGPAPIEHIGSCNFQRTTCEAYPHLARCEVCQTPCAHCAGKNRWCPHCYERQCLFRYKRVVHGREAPGIDAGPSTGATVNLKPGGAGRRATTVSFAGTANDKRASRVG